MLKKILSKIAIILLTTIIPLYFLNVSVYCNETTNSIINNPEITAFKFYDFTDPNTINDNFDYEINNTNLILKKYIGDPSIKNIKIQTISQHITIEDECFKGLKNLESFSINYEINYPTGSDCTLGNKCFFDCSALTSISLGKIVKIGSHNFDNCNYLNSSFTFENCTIDKDTFCDIHHPIDDSNFCSLYLNFKNCNIANYAINNYTSEQNKNTIQVSTDNCNISNRAFYNCKNLIAAFIHNCSNIGDEAFYGCSNCQIQFDPANSSDSSTNIMNIGANAFYGVSNLSTYLNGNNILPSNIGILDINAFNGVNSTKPIYYVNSNDYSHVNNVQKYPDKYKGFIVEKNSSENYYELIYYVGDYKNIIIPDEIDGIPTVYKNDLFANAKPSIGNITFPKNMTCIPKEAFTNDTFTGSINLDNITIVDESAFKYATNLNSAISKGTKKFSPVTINNSAFFATDICNENIDFSNLEIVGNNAFKSCNNLKNDIYLNKIKEIDCNGFSTNSDIKLHINNYDAIIYNQFTDNPIIYVPYDFNIDNFKNEDGTSFSDSDLTKNVTFTGSIPTLIDYEDTTINTYYNLKSHKLDQDLSKEGFNIELIDDEGTSYYYDLSNYKFKGGKNISSLHFKASLTEASKITVTFITDNNTILKSEIIYSNQNPYSFAPDPPKKEGYKFTRWISSKQSNGDIIYTASYEKSNTLDSNTSDNFTNTFLFLGTLIVSFIIITAEKRRKLCQYAK